jgi:hypothetical protein
MDAKWVEGRCGRNHDITNPANVRVDEQGRRRCRQCCNYRNREYRGGRTPTDSESIRNDGRVCERENCTRPVIRRAREGVAVWRLRRYCSRECWWYRARPLLPEAEVQRLRRLVGLA